jgi:hypothetical protein
VHASGPHTWSVVNRLNRSTHSRGSRSAAGSRATDHGRQVVYGRGPSIGLRSSVQTQPRPLTARHDGNRSITGVFITRLDVATTPRQLELHIRRETNMQCTPERIITRYNGYSSFYIRASKDVRSVLLEPNLWPRGTLIKPYYS